MLKRFGLYLSIAMVSLVVLAARGGDDDGNGNGDNNGGGDTIDMEMGEMYFDPDSISGDAGSSLTINLDNAGNQLHDFTIDDLDGERIHVEVASGEEDSVTLELPDEAGDIEFYCTIPGHRESGMEGVLTVN